MRFMLKLPPIPPIVTTTLLFALLLAMLTMSSKQVYTFPYASLDTCFVNNIDWQTTQNKDLLAYIAEKKRPFYYRDIEIKAQHVHRQAIHCLSTCKRLQRKLLTYGYSKQFSDSISNTLFSFHRFIIQQIGRVYQQPLSEYMLTGINALPAALANLKLLSPDDRLTLFYAIQYYILYEEHTILKELSIEKSGCILDVDASEIMAVPGKSFCYPGEKIHTRIFKALYNKAIDPTITVDRGGIDTVMNGVAQWSGRTHKLGLQYVHGTATIHTQINKIEQTITRPWSFSYVVIAPGISLSLDKMHLLYAGIPTIVTLSAPGYEPEKLTLRVPGAMVKKTGDGQYEVIANRKTKKLWAYLDAENEKGDVTTLEGMEIKVVPPPQPAVVIEDNDTGFLPAADLQHPQQLIARPAAYNYDLSTKYTIHSFEYTLLLYDKKTTIGPVRVDGSTLPAIADTVEHGSLFISNIECSDEYGNSYEPLTTSFFLQ